MKTLKCDLCDHEETAETFDAWMKALMSHYMQAHADVMNSKAGLSDEEKKAEQQKWMVENKARFEAVK